MPLTARLPFKFSLPCLLVTVLAACGGSNESPSPQKALSANVPIEVANAASSVQDAASAASPAALAASEPASDLPSSSPSVKAKGAVVTSTSNASAATGPSSSKAQAALNTAAVVVAPVITSGDTTPTSSPVAPGPTSVGTIIDTTPTPTSESPTAKASASTPQVIPACVKVVNGCRYGNEAYLLGAYYFPGWSNNQRGSNFTQPWNLIRPYPEREPLLGWYNDSDPTILRQQANQMRRGGLHYVVFDSYWDGQGAFLEQSLRAYRSIWQTGDPQYALLWANHYPWKDGRANATRMIDRWIAQYLNHAGYLRIDGRPVLYVFSVEDYEKNAKEMGLANAAALTKLLNDRMKSAGLPELYLIGGTPALAHWSRGVAVTAGFQALSAYNYHIGYSGEAQTASALASNFSQLAANYAQNWNWLARNTSLTYVVPMSTGWDKTPWLDRAKGETTYKGIASPAEFEQHLRAGKAIMDANTTRTRRMGIVCCWNEFGEGSYLEPTKQRGTQVLDAVRKVYFPAP
jgi:hypothetical protein